MSARFRVIAVGGVCAALAWVVSAGNAQPVPKDPPLKAPPKAATFTAFPDLKPPIQEVNGRRFASYDPIIARLEAMLAEYVKRTPADAPPLRNVRLAQLAEGVACLKQTVEIQKTGRFAEADYADLVTMTVRVLRLGADTSDDPAEKIKWLEDAVQMLKLNEAYLESRVAAGIVGPQKIHQASFHRLQAEADLLQLKEQIEKARKK